MIHWIKAARLRTLPLSLSGIIVGGFLALSKEAFDVVLFVLALLTTILFQVLSNFANDYGDGVKGTDAGRIGEERMLESGKISKKSLFNGIILVAVFSLISMLVLIYLAFFPNYLQEFYVFVGLGIACVLAAIFYTMGKNPYGYFGFGDVFVLVFFGLVSVLGSEFLFTKTFDYYSILPALAIGFFSVSVMNLNNMRDYENDIKANKKTFAQFLGKKNARIYELITLFLPFPLCLIYVLIKFPDDYVSLLFLLLFFPLQAIRRQIMEVKNEAEYDPFLKKVALLTFVFSILFGLSISGIINL